MNWWLYVQTTMILGLKKLDNITNDFLFLSLQNIFLLLASNCKLNHKDEGKFWDAVLDKISFKNQSR